MGAIIVSILLVRKWEHRKVVQLAQGHTPSTLYRQDLNRSGQILSRNTRKSQC